MKIEQKMAEMGFSEQLSGTAMLRVGVALYERGAMLTKEVYPAIARACDSTPQRVERSMRHAIGRAWEVNAGAVARLRHYGATDGAPTVGAFIARMARGEG